MSKRPCLNYNGHSRRLRCGGLGRGAAPEPHGQSHHARPLEKRAGHVAGGQDRRGDRPVDRQERQHRHQAGQAEEQKQPGYRWPTDASGKKICDVAHPMPTWNERQTLSDPNVWAHPRAKPIKPRKVVGKKITPYRAFCPVCHRPFFIGRPLIEVLCEPDNFGKQKQRKIIEL